MQGLWDSPARARLWTPFPAPEGARKGTLGLRPERPVPGRAVPIR